VPVRLTPHWHFFLAIGAFLDGVDDLLEELGGLGGIVRGWVEDYAVAEVADV